MAYQGFLEELAKICPDACIFKSPPNQTPKKVIQLKVIQIPVSYYYSCSKAQIKTSWVTDGLKFFYIVYVHTEGKCFTENHTFFFALVALQF